MRVWPFHQIDSLVKGASVGDSKAKAARKQPWYQRLTILGFWAVLFLVVTACQASDQESNVVPVAIEVPVAPTAPPAPTEALTAPTVAPSIRDTAALPPELVSQGQKTFTGPWGYQIRLQNVAAAAFVSSS